MDTENCSFDTRVLMCPVILTREFWHHPKTWHKIWHLLKMWGSGAFVATKITQGAEVYKIIHTLLYTCYTNNKSKIYLKF